MKRTLCFWTHRPFLHIVAAQFVNYLRKIIDYFSFVHTSCSYAIYIYSHLHGVIDTMGILHWYIGNTEIRNEEAMQIICRKTQYNWENFKRKQHAAVRAFRRIYAFSKLKHRQSNISIFQDLYIRIRLRPLTINSNNFSCSYKLLVFVELISEIARCLFISNCKYKECLSPNTTRQSRFE
jgi:hypothetical protein